MLFTIAGIGMMIAARFQSPLGGGVLFTRTAGTDVQDRVVSIASRRGGQGKRI